MPLTLAPRWPTRPSLDTGWLTVIGRVKAGLTTTDVERQLTVSAARIAASQPSTRVNAAPRVRAHGFGPNSTPIEIVALVTALLALPLIVLAIGCANVANLHLARVAEQSRELAVLRVPRPSPSYRGVAALPARARRQSAPGPRRRCRRHSDTGGLASVSPLRWGHGRRRTPHPTPDRHPGLHRRTRA